MSNQKRTKAGTHVAFNAGRGFLEGRLRGDGSVSVTLDPAVRIVPDAGLISDGPGRALAPNATQGDHVGGWQPKADQPDEPDDVIAEP